MFKNNLINLKIKFIIFILVSSNRDVMVDWEFLDSIYKNREMVPRQMPEEERKDFKFDATKYHDAVIMPWYRNKDQPQVYKWKISF